MFPSGPLQQCIGYPCRNSDLPSVSNGDYSAAQFDSGTNISVTCNEHYKKVAGDAKCDSRSKYSGTLPKCQGEYFIDHRCPEYRCVIPLFVGFMISDMAL